MEMNYFAYSDESYVKDRFRSIATFSFRAEYHARLDAMLIDILNGSNISEFKWHKLKDAKYRFCAIKILDELYNCLHKMDARVDVLIWDTYDSRHNVQGRDDVANYGRMYFHLHSQMMRRRPKGAQWYLYPDEYVQLDWGTVSQCLEMVGRRQQYIESPLLGDFLSDAYYGIRELKLVESSKTPCCQVADLFAGLSVFSKMQYDLYEKWIKTGIASLQLFADEDIATTNREENRFIVLKEFNLECKKRKLGVSLKSHRCLSTPNPDYPLNFWHYKPQHALDRAPQK
jgi:hypothetical protein